MRVRSYHHWITIWDTHHRKPTGNLNISIWKKKTNIYYQFFVLSGLVSSPSTSSVIQKRLRSFFNGFKVISLASVALRTALRWKDRQKKTGEGRIDFNSTNILQVTPKRTHRNCGTLSIFCNCFLGAAVLSKWSTSTPTSSHASSAAAFKPFSAAASSADDTLPGTASRGSCKLCLHPSPFTTCKHLISWEISY